MTYEYILIQTEQKVGLVQFNRPRALNALNREMVSETVAALESFDRDPGVGCMVITGSERAFAAGADIKQMAQATPVDMLDNPFIDYWDRLRRLNKPVIAAVSGFCLGGGCELAMACDIIIAAEHASFGLPEPRRGLIAGAVGVHRLARQTGLKPAMGYMLTGRHMSASRAYQLGLVNEVVNSDELTTCTQGYIDDILACAPLAVRATKESVMRGMDYPLPQAFYTEYESERRRQRSEHALEGPRAFAEKRPPNWQGR